MCEKECEDFNSNKATNGRLWQSESESKNVGTLSGGVSALLPRESQASVL